MSKKLRYVQGYVALVTDEHKTVCGCEHTGHDAWNLVYDRDNDIAYVGVEIMAEVFNENT